MFRCLPASTIFGEIIHMEQSPVGKVLSSMTIVPPIDESFWTIWTLSPLSARSRAACIPPMPPPTTRTAPFFLEDVLLIGGLAFSRVQDNPQNVCQASDPEGRRPWRFRQAR